MRFEEILGSRWEDISDGWITVSRAVVHPTRNMPEIKCPKTATSERIIPCSRELTDILSDGYEEGFILPTRKDPRMETPMSYTESRRVFNKIRERFDILDYTAHDFRDTCATVWRENGMPLDIIARLLGHAKTETTERRYVKYRDDILSKARQYMR
jgi:integrase